MRALLIKPGIKKPIIIDLKEDNSGSCLDSMYEILDDYIEVLSVYSPNNTNNISTDFIMAENGKIFHMPINRKLTGDIYFGNKDNTCFDICCGNIIIVECNENDGSFQDISNENIEYFTKRMQEPDVFIEHTICIEEIDI